MHSDGPLSVFLGQFCGRIRHIFCGQHSIEAVAVISGPGPIRKHVVGVAMRARYRRTPHDDLLISRSVAM